MGQAGEQKAAPDHYRAGLLQTGQFQGKKMLNQLTSSSHNELYKYGITKSKQHAVTEKTGHLIQKLLLQANIILINCSVCEYCSSYPYCILITPLPGKSQIIISHH